MEPIFKIVFLALSVMLLGALTPWVAVIGLRLLSATAAGISDLVTNSFGSATQWYGAWQSRRSTFAAAAQVVRSRRNRTSRRTRSNQIYALAEVVRHDVAVCNDLHHYAGDVLGVEHMNELEDNIVCAAYRDRVLQTVDVTIESLLKSEVAHDITAAKMLLAMDRMRDICADCQLLHHAHAAVPKLCDPCKHMGGSEQETRA